MSRISHVAVAGSLKSNQNDLANLSRTLLILRATSLVLVTTGIVGFSPSSFAQYEATAYIPNGTVVGHTTTPGDVTYTYDEAQGGGSASAVVTFTASPVASVRFATTVFNPLGEGGLNGGGIMTYRFEVEAQPFTYVPIDFSGFYSSFSTPASPGSGAFTSFLVQTVDSSVLAYSTFESYFQGDCGAPTCLQYTTFNNITYTSTQSDASHVEGSFEGTLDMLTGVDGTVIGMVQLFAGGGANVAFVPASAWAFIDPHLEIDVAFLAANPGATLTITPGVGNDTTSVASVPEPGTLALLGFSLAGLAFTRRRKQQSTDNLNEPARVASRFAKVWIV